jgi:hypothetical protein
MAQTTFDQDIFIAAPLERVRTHLTALMTRIEEIHPLVIATQHVKTTTAPDGSAIEHYRVRDRMKLGPFSITFTYRVEMSASPEGRLVSHAYQSPGIHLYNTTWCEPEGNGTRVREHIEITAPRLLMNITYNGAATAHQELFAKLKARLEQEHPPA